MAAAPVWGGGAGISPVQRLSLTGGERAGAVRGAVVRSPGPDGQAAPAPRGNALLHPLRPAGPACPAGPGRLDKGVWCRTWERVLRLPPGRPFRRDFGDFCSSTPNYFHLFTAKTIF